MNFAEVARTKPISKDNAKKINNLYEIQVLAENRIQATSSVLMYHCDDSDDFIY